MVTMHCWTTLGNSRHWLGLGGLLIKTIHSSCLWMQVNLFANFMASFLLCLVSLPIMFLLGMGWARTISILLPRLLVFLRSGAFSRALMRIRIALLGLLGKVSKKRVFLI